MTRGCIFYVVLANIFQFNLNFTAVRLKPHISIFLFTLLFTLSVCHWVLHKYVTNKKTLKMLYVIV